AFDGDVFPGTYRVSVRGYSSDIPSERFVALPSLSVGQDATGLVLDVVTVPVGGVVAMNGQQPMSSCGSSDRAYVDFHDSVQGYSHTVNVPCNGATSAFTFQGLVYPGVYRISVRGYSSTLPSEAYIVFDRVQIP
ncbi:MAG: hypothetical protein KC933_34655, partial [Myxococcales bacterium]|nr:hypothetical protein [Myxococcales bacterium]